MSEKTGEKTPFYDTEPIEAIKLKRPGRIVFAVVLVVLTVLFVWDAAVVRQAYDWPEVGKYLFDRRIVEAVGVTLVLTILSMILAVVVGVTLAIMRMSPNTVVRSVAWVYLWLFRGTPVYVQLVFWGLLATIYKSVDFGIPGLDPLASIEVSGVLKNAFMLCILGLGLNESAYMAEIVRAGLISVDKGQNEAATALGLGWWHTMSRIVLPQAMRVIIPPTGNEFISLLKTTSLVTAVPFTLELYTRTRDISAVTYKPVPMLIVASVWYLAVTSILMVGQYYLERHFAKGANDRPKVMKPTVATGVITLPEAAEIDGAGGSTNTADSVAAPGATGQER